MKRSSFQLFKNETQRYTAYGALFGITFPITATILKMIFNGLPFSLASVIEIQETDPVLWIVDTAPIFLGFFSSLAGRRQDALQQLASELSLREKSLTIAQATLEERVKERTAELDAANTQAEARTAQLRSVTELSQTIALVQEPEELLPRVAQQISERFGFYHVGIFLLDDKNEFAVLRASNSAGGRRMLERHFKLKIGGAGIVGFVAQSGRPRLALDTGADAIFFRTSDLPETRSEVSLPLKIGEQIIGVLDMQSTQASAFNDEDVSVLNILANQVAIIIQNSQLFAQTRAALESYTKTSRATGKATGYSYQPDGTTINAPTLDEYQLQNILASNRTVGLEPVSEGTAPTLAVPVKLRDQVIGIIHIEAAEANRNWSDDENALVQSISERAALALENAQLFEETSRRAERERLISRITSHIGESTNFDRIMQTTIQELGRTLGTTRAFIQLETPSSGKSDPASPQASVD